MFRICENQPLVANAAESCLFAPLPIPVDRSPSFINPSGLDPFAGRHSSLNDGGLFQYFQWAKV
jgi:hypothetical protein